MLGERIRPPWLRRLYWLQAEVVAMATDIAEVIGGAVAMLPDRFASWVRPGGRLFAIVGRPPAMQAVLHRRLDESQWHRETLFETALPYLRNAAPQPRFAL